MTTGNEAGLQLADVIAWLARDDATRVIAMVYMEAAATAPRLRGALATARPASRWWWPRWASPRPGHARQSHTASLTGEDAVYQAVFDEYNVHRADTLEAFFRLGYVLSRGRRPARWSSPRDWRPARWRRSPSSPCRAGSAS